MKVRRFNSKNEFEKTWDAEGPILDDFCLCFAASRSDNFKEWYEGFKRAVPKLWVEIGFESDGLTYSAESWFEWYNSIPQHTKDFLKSLKSWAEFDACEMGRLDWGEGGGTTKEGEIHYA